jgi:hypothetical protein
MQLGRLAALALLTSCWTAPRRRRTLARSGSSLTGNGVRLLRGRHTFIGFYDLYFISGFIVVRLVFIFFYVTRKYVSNAVSISVSIPLVYP